MGDVRGSTSRIEGAVAQGTAPLSTDNPVNIGGLASSSVPAAVSDGQITRVWLDDNGRLHVTGDLTHNTTPPSAKNIGTLSGLANASGPTYIEGDQVLLSLDLSGNLRVTNGSDVIKRNGMNLQLVYDVTNRKILEEILLNIKELSRKIFE